MGDVINLSERRPALKLIVDRDGNIEFSTDDTRLGLAMAGLDYALAQVTMKLGIKD